MESKEFKIEDLKRGDIVRHLISGESYLIDGNYGKFAIAIRTIKVTNPFEWEVVKQ